MAQQQKSTTSIKVLSLVWYKVLPPLYGGQKGVALFNEYLGRLIPLTCLCAKTNEPIETSYTVDNSLPAGKGQFLNPFCWRKIISTAKRDKTTHLLLEFPYHGFIAVLCKRILGVKLVLHSHNIESIRFQEQGKRWWKALFALERWTMKNADVVFFKTEKDQTRAIDLYKFDKHKSVIVPYGVEARNSVNKQKARDFIFDRHSIAPGTKLLLFAATLDYGPNAMAMKDFEAKLIPLLNKQDSVYKIIVCGRIVYKSFDHLKCIHNENLLYAGNVTDIDVYFAAADAFLNPVLSGGGVQTKMIDALNADLNVVCFEGMQEGIAGAENKIFTASKNDWPAFADATSRALNYHSPTPSAFFQHHDWNTIAAKAFSFLQNT